MKSANLFTSYFSTFIAELVTPQSNYHNNDLLAWHEFSAPRSEIVLPIEEPQDEITSWKEDINKLTDFDQIVPYLKSNQFAIREYATIALANLPLSNTVIMKFQHYWNDENPEVRSRVRNAYGLSRFLNLPPVLKDNELAGLLDLTPQLMEGVYYNITKSVKADMFTTAESEIARELQCILEKVKKLELIQDRFTEIRKLGLSGHWYGRQLSHSYLNAITNKLTEDLTKLDSELCLYHKIMNENLKLTKALEPGHLVELISDAKNFSEGISGQLRFSDEAEKIISVVRKHRANDIITFQKALKDENPTLIIELAPKLAEYDRLIIHPILGSSFISVDWDFGKETIFKLVEALNNEQRVEIDFYSKVIDTSRRYLLNSTERENIQLNTVTKLFSFYHSMSNLNSSQRELHEQDLEIVINDTLHLGSSLKKFRISPIEQLQEEYEALLIRNENELARTVFLKLRAYFISESQLIDLNVSRESEVAKLFEEKVLKASMQAGTPTLDKELQKALGKAWSRRNELHERHREKLKSVKTLYRQQEIERLSDQEQEDIANTLMQAMLQSQFNELQNIKK